MKENECPKNDSEDAEESAWKQGETVGEEDALERVREEPESVETGSADSSTRKEVDEKLDDADKHLDALKRTMADFENYRKRMQKEKAFWKRDARGEVISSVLETLDNLERAVENLEDGDAEGVSKVLDGLKNALSQFGLTEIDPLNEEFDPNFHEVMMTEEREDLPEDTVVKVLSKGYKLEEKLLRPAKVVVSK